SVTEDNIAKSVRYSQAQDTVELEVFQNILERPDHLVLEPPPEFAPEGRNAGEKHHRSLNDPGLQTPTREVIKPARAVVAMIGLEDHAQIGPDFVAEDLPPGHSEKGVWSQVSHRRTCGQTGGKAVEKAIKPGRVSTLVGHNAHKIGALAIHVSFQDLPEVGQLRKWTGDQPVNLL